MHGKNAVHNYLPLSQWFLIMSLSELSFLTPQAGYTEGVEQYCATWKVMCLREEGKDGGQTV